MEIQIGRFKRLTLLIIIAFIGIAVSPAGAQAPRVKGDVKCIENPTPTHVEKESHYVKLEVVHEIHPEINDETFMVRPWYLTVGNTGEIYAFDKLVLKVFHFGNLENGFKFINTFGRTGQGPGEYGKGYSVWGINFSQDGYLYLSDRLNRKFIRFEPNGRHVKDLRLPSTLTADGGFLPIISTAGDYYVLTGTHCTMDAYNLRDPGKKKYTLLDRTAFDKSVVLEVRKQDYFFWYSASLGDIIYDVLADDRLVVYLAQTSSLHIYDKGSLVKKINIWPQKALEDYSRKIDKRSKSLGPNGVLIVKMFYTMFVDKDDEKYFYLEKTGRVDGKFLTYKFDLEGNLVKVLYMESPMRILAKKNDLFYGVYKDTIKILKETTDEKKNL